MSKVVEKLLDEANKFIEENQFSRAINSLEKALKEDSDNAEVYKNLGLCYYNLKNNTKAQENFTKALELNADDATSLFFIASINLLNMDNVAAKEQFQKVLELRPAYKDAYKNLGITYFKLKENQNAVDTLEKGLEHADDTEEYYRLLASAYIITKQNKKACELLEEFIKKNNTESYELYNLLGSAHLGIPDNKKAELYYNKALFLNPQNEIAMRALKLIAATELSSEIEEYKKLVDSKDNTQDIIEIADILHKEGKIDEALSVLNYAIEKGFEDVDIYYQISILYEDKGLVMESLKWLKKILKATTPKKEVELKIAKLFLNINKLKEAFALFDKLTKKYPYDPEVYYEYAQAYILYDEKIKAEEYLKKVINMDSDNRLSALAHKDMGCIYIQQNQMNYAQEEFEKAYEIAPEDDLICYECGSYEFMSGNYEKALELYLKALKLNPYQDEYKVAVALLYNNMKRFMDTINLLTPLMPKIQRLPKVAYPLAVAFYEMGRYESAESLFILFCEITQDIETYNYLALTYEKLGKYKEALNIINKILTQFPDNTNVLTLKARCLHKLNNPKQAEDQYIEILSKFANFEEAVIGLLELYKETNQLNKAKDFTARLNEDDFSEEALQFFSSIKAL